MPNSTRRLSANDSTPTLPSIQMIPSSKRGSISPKKLAPSAPGSNGSSFAEESSRARAASIISAYTKPSSRPQPAKLPSSSSVSRRRSTIAFGRAFEPVKASTKFAMIKTKELSGVQPTATASPADAAAVKRKVEGLEKHLGRFASAGYFPPLYIYLKLNLYIYTS